MAVPSSGELKLWDTLWNQELAGSKGENSLHSASVYAGFSTPDALSDFYGWSDVEVPTLTTNASTSVTGNSFTANGNVTNTGNEDVSRGFYIGTSTNYASNTKHTLGGTQGTGTFNFSKTGLSGATTYYVNAWASNSAGETVGNQVSTTTSFVNQSIPTGGEGFGAHVPFSQGVSQGANGWYINPINSGLVHLGGQSHAQANTFGTKSVSWSTVCLSDNARNRRTVGQSDYHGQRSTFQGYYSVGHNPPSGRGFSSITHYIQGFENSNQSAGSGNISGHGNKFGTGPSSVCFNV